MPDTKKRRTGKKPTRKDYLGRIKLCMDLLSRGYRKTDIKVICSKQYGVGYRTVENYLSRARSTLLSEMGTTREEMRMRSLDCYRSILRGNPTPREAILAQARIDKLLGLEDHSVKVQQTGTITHEHGGLELRIVEILKRNPEQRDVVLDLARRLGVVEDRSPFVSG
jgi:hypothetical protein